MDHLFVDVPFLVDDSISISPKEMGSWRATLEYEVFGTGEYTHAHLRCARYGYYSTGAPPFDSCACALERGVA